MDSNQTKVAYARFDNPENVDVALHLTNTVMVDRALIVLPYPDGEYPILLQIGVCVIHLFIDLMNRCCPTAGYCLFSPFEQRLSQMR